MADSLVWNRNDISSCNCSDKSYRHVHCPCQSCNGKGVDRDTEFRHWKNAKLSSKGEESLNDFQLRESCDHSNHTPSLVNDIPEEEEDILNVENIDQHDEDVEFDEDDGHMHGNNEESNPLKTLVVNAVLDALAITKDSGASLKTFQEILDYGKNLLLARIDNNNVDRDIILTLWPKTWNSVQKLLREEGYEDAKLYYICICGEEKEYKRNGKTNTKMVYSGKYSLMENKDDLCTHCHKKGYLKYYYLGLNTKVKNWYKSKEMCKRMLSHWDARNNCPNCFKDFVHFPQTAHGSPLNLGLIGHWDGWQPFGTSYRGCGSIEVTIANMTKCDRSHVEEVYVLGFVPSSEVPKLPEALDPFLLPLMTDLCTGFINGFKVYYPHDMIIEDYSVSEEETVRVLLLCWSGDHPGQCEVGKILNQGRCPCRRCKLIGKQIENSSNTHMYYGENRYHYRFHWEERSIESSLDDMFNIDHETRVSVRKSLSSAKGFTGTSILHTYLYPLYGFDILKHMTYDIFHTIPLNVVKNQLERLLEQKIIDQSYLDNQIKAFPWTKGLQDGRIPTPLGNCTGLGHWKAEGLRKFAFPMADCIFMDKITSKKELEIHSLISRLTEMYFVSGRRAWNDCMIELHRKLAWRLNILIEEVQGLNMCTISLHNLVHIHEDIMNFSAPDNYWCATFERAVKQYVKNSHNCKGIEATFAQSESRREFLKPLKEKVEPIRTGNLNKESRFASSTVAAERAFKEDPSCGLFLLGGMSNVKELLFSERVMIGNSLNIPVRNVPPSALISKKAFIANTEFMESTLTQGDTVIVNVNEQELVMKISNFLSVRCFGQESSSLFVLGRQYEHQLTGDGSKIQDFWSGFVKVCNQRLENTIVLLSNVKRKVILFNNCPDGSLWVIDYQRHLEQLPYEVVVPLYFKEGDMILIQGEQVSDIWYGHVQRVNHQNQSVDVFFYVESSRSRGVYVRETPGRHALNTVHWDSAVGFAHGEWISNTHWKVL